MTDKIRVVEIQLYGDDAPYTAFIMTVPNAMENIEVKRILEELDQKFYTDPDKDAAHKLLKGYGFGSVTSKSVALGGGL